MTSRIKDAIIEAIYAMSGVRFDYSHFDEHNSIRIVSLATEPAFLELLSDALEMSVTLDMTYRAQTLHELVQYLKSPYEINWRKKHVLRAA